MSIRQATHLCLAALLILTTACGDADRAERARLAERDRQVAAGLRAFEIADGPAALAAFNRAIELDPAHGGARIGAAIAHTMALMDLTVFAVSAVGGFETDIQPLAEPPLVDPTGLPRAVDEGAALFTLLEQIFDALIVETRAAQDVLQPIMDGTIDARIDIPRLTIRLMGTRHAEFGGDWDRSDALMLDGLAALVEANLQVVRAHHIRFNLYDTVWHIFNRTKIGQLDIGDPQDLIGDGQGGASGLVPAALNALVYMLNGTANFLAANPGDSDGIKGADGDTRMQTARERFGRAFGDFARLRPSVEAERDAQSDDIVRIDDGQLLLSGRIYSRHTGAARDISVELADGLTESLQKLEASFVNGAGAVGWADDVLPIVATFGIFVGKILVEDLDKYSAFLDPAVARSFVLDIVPDVLQLDPGAMVTGGKKVRDLLPAFRSRTSTVTVGTQQATVKPEEANFLFEWECATGPLGLTSSFPDGGLLCPANAALQSAAHFSDPLFAGTVTAIADDRIASDVPAIPFRDPTFGGLLKLDLSRSDTPAMAALETTAGTFTPADNLRLNALVGQVVHNVVSLLDGL